jgi:uncharacterized protein YceK
MRRTPLLSLAAAICLAGCGSPSSTTTAGEGKGAVDNVAAKAPAMETRWLRGLWASDIRKALPAQNLTCQGPKQEGQTTAWSCEWGTPLVHYKVLYYGSAPGKIEYLNATVTQSNQPKDSLALPLFASLAGLHFDGGNPVQAREWVQKTTPAGGQTVFGPAKFKLSGDVTRRVLEIKASGSEW